MNAAPAAVLAEPQQSQLQVVPAAAADGTGLWGLGDAQYGLAKDILVADEAATPGYVRVYSAKFCKKYGHPVSWRLSVSADAPEVTRGAFVVVVVVVL